MALFMLDNVKVNDILEIDKLEMKQNKVTCITGQSGSGKSTLLRLLNRLDDPDNGEILFGERPITDIDPLKLRSQVVMIPQTPVIFDGTIRENLQIGLTFSGEEMTDEGKLKEVMEKLALDKTLDQHAADLSGGEKQRVALGRGMLMEKAVAYLLDEPTSALDDVTAEKVINRFIQDASANQRSIVMVSHDSQLVERFADEIINMDDYSMSIHSRKGDYA